MLLLSYGQGFERALTQAYLQIGKDLVVVFPGQTSMQAGGERSGRPVMLELKDVTAIQEGVPTVEAVSPEVRHFFPLVFNERTRSYSVAGVYASYERIRNTAIATGRFLSEEDVLQRRRVVVIGENLRHELFSGLPALGGELKIGGVRFTVIGVLEKKTQITNYEPPDDLTAFIPFTTFSGMIDTHYLQDIVLLPASNQFRDRIEKDVRAALARAHNFNVNDTRAVTIIEWNKFLAIITSVSLGLKILLTIIGTFTLSIGAVGVVNIMLVSVTERTREIGVRKAIGATRKNILAQFTMEAVTLCMVGGLMGILTGALLTLILHFAVGFLHASLSLTWVLIAFAVSCIIGLVFGIYPAWKAANLDPIEALRYE
jgi:putative ABC transport system permease protein